MPRNYDPQRVFVMTDDSSEHFVINEPHCGFYFCLKHVHKRLVHKRQDCIPAVLIFFTKCIFGH